MIKINQNYTIIGKDLNFIIECVHDTKDLEEQDKEKNSTKKSKYFSTFQGMVDFLCNQEDIDLEDLSGVKNICEKVNKIIDNLKHIDIDKTKSLTFIIGENWQILGSYMFYKIVKKETIQKSRFTKEENIGKDKHVTLGFVPTLYIGLRVILNQIILDGLSNTDYTDLSDLELAVDMFVEDLNSFKIEEYSAKNNSDSLDEPFDDESYE